MKITHDTPSTPHISQRIRDEAETSARFSQILARQETSLRADTEQARPEEPEPAIRDTLMELLHMSPAERIRYTLLRQMGLTEESLRQLPPQERMKVEALIQEETKRQLAGQDGALDTGA
ncbi:hypothetical protein [Marinobacterium weihaiense]|uniref:Uncharacterized protein n=1 Tax=Marinobacterium weihaiense TaxID=2851016 RepID=A0ABS6M6J0_9GAMM|nr:hypothetical protein [Marinobacterium weihaiense]MBV0931898.1 hypothetical protein [Marinobacterium weihaiense]